MKSAAALVCAAAVVACSPEVQGPGVIHLDPRLEDGRSSARELAEHGEKRVLAEVVLAAPDTPLAPWRLENAGIKDVAGGRGFYLFGNVPDGGAFKKVELVLEQPLDAAAVDAIELVLARTQRGLARATWRTSGDAADADTWVRHVNAHVEDSEGEQVVRLELADHPEWKGRIERLAIAPKQDGFQRFQLVAVRLLGGSFTGAPDPLGPDAGDAGLAALEREARRTWPTDLGVPLIARFELPEPAHLVVQVGLSGRARDVREPITLTIDGRTPGDPYRILAELVLPPGEGRELVWRTLAADLAAFAGGACELRLRSFAGEPRGDLLQGTDGKLMRPAVYWAEPLVIPMEAARARPNIVLVTLDTVRADAIGAFSRAASRTPYLDALAARSHAFDNAWSACNATTPSHASILTGLSLRDHGVSDNRSMLAAENATLAELLRAAGWTTAAAVSVEHLQTGKSGLGQGFDRFLLAQSDSARDGAITIRAVKAWLEEWKQAGERPFFLWVHLFDPHTPYGPPQEFLDAYATRYGITQPPKRAEPANLPPNTYTQSGEFLEGVDNKAYAEFLYQAAVAYTDALIENLASELARHGWLEDTAMIVVADHGEALGEHGHWYNHLGLFDEVMRVPLIVHLPGQDEGLRVPELAWALDIAPTVLEIAGVPPAPGLRGASLLALARERGEGRRLWFEHSGLQQTGSRDDQFHFIQSFIDYAPWDGAPRRAKGQRELYDHRGDPELARDLAGLKPELAEALSHELSRYRASSLERTGLRGDLTPEQEERLRELGYLDDDGRH